MPKYELVAIVERMVTDTVKITVESDDEREAYVLAGKVLQKFPNPHDLDGVDFCYVDNRQYHDPEHIDIRDQEDEGVG